MARKDDVIQPIPASFDEVVRSMVPKDRGFNEIVTDDVDLSG